MAKAIAAKMRASRISAKFTREQVVSILAIALEDYVKYETSAKKVPDSVREDLFNLFGGSRSYWMSDEDPKETVPVLSLSKKTEE